MEPMMKTTHAFPPKMLVNSSYFSSENGTFFKVVTKSFVSTTCSKRSCFGGVSALREHFESGRFHLKKR